ncbi:MAG: elongation factor Ts [Chlamydiia bacterium]|nr:elongation factor Ts [Chlamydiia bacterium]
MTAISAQMIKELRERTGVAMGKCKEALAEANGDMDLAIENLRKSGAASAVKKASRETKEGQIGFVENEKQVALVEVSAETDFVVNNERFQEFLSQMADEALKISPKSLEDFLKAKSTVQPELTIEELRTNLVQSLGENIQIKRLEMLDKSQDKSLGVYSHMRGKILTVVELKGTNGEEELAKGIAMHVAAASPEYLNPEAVPASVIEQERAIAKDQMKGKPENIIEKILAGKLEAYYGEVCLNRQKYIRDDSLTIDQLVEKRSKEIGKPLKLVSFTRWNVGN